MKTLWIIDSDKSAIASSAKLNASKGDQIFVSDNFPSLNRMLSTLSRLDADRVIFAWREPLFGILHSSKSSALYRDFVLDREVFVLIPDFLGLLSNGGVQELCLEELVDGFLFTSNELLDIYRPQIKLEIKCLRYFDKIDEEGSAKWMSLPKKTGKVIWVGNSKWGSRRGFHDHKGFETVIQPLMEYCSSVNCGHTYEIVDSSKKYKSNIEVLKLIRESEFLLMPSKSEGTGLPFLEALSLGTVPLVTKTGVAPEILKGKYAKLILNRDVSDFAAALHDTSNYQFINCKGLRDLCYSYTSQGTLDFPLIQKFPKNFVPEVKLFKSFVFSLKFFYRFLRFTISEKNRVSMS